MKQRITGKRVLAMFMALIMVLGSLYVAPVPVQAAGKQTIKLNYSEYTLKKGGRLKLKAKTSPGKYKVVWSSSRKKVASVNQKGVVRGLKKGTSKITATIEGTTRKAVCKVSVGTPVKKITVKDKRIQMAVGEELHAEYTITPANATNKGVTFTSSKKSAAEVDKKGVIQAKSEGRAVITIKAKDGSGKKAKVTVNVVKREDAGTAATTEASATTATQKTTEKQAATEIQKTSGEADNTETQKNTEENGTTEQKAAEEGQTTEDSGITTEEATEKATTEQTAPGKATTEKTTTEQAATEKATTETATTQQATTQAATTQQATTQAATTQQVTTQAATTQQATTQAATTQQVTTQAATTQQATTQETTTQQATTQAATTQQATTQAATTQQATTQAVTTQQVTTQEATTQQATTQEATTQQATTQAATTQQATTQESTTQEPVKYKVKFETNGGSAVPEQEVEEGKKAEKPADPTQEGRTFAGWYQNPELTQGYDFDAAVKGAVTLYAKWDVSPVFRIPENLELKVGQNSTPDVTWNQGVEKKALVWSCDDETVAVVIDAKGTVHAISPGTCHVTASVKSDPEMAVSMTVTVSKEDLRELTVNSQAELDAALEGHGQDTKDIVITLQTQEETLEISKGIYEHITLVVDAPKATITNRAKFKQVLINALKDDTWIEHSGNQLYFNEPKVHVVVAEGAAPSLTILGGADSVTVENNGNLQSILIAKAAEVVVKGDSTASKVEVDNMAGGKITTFVPLDITSTTTFELTVGEGGEQTAVQVETEEDLPSVTGLGTITITIAETQEEKEVIAEYDEEAMEDLFVEVKKTSVKGRICSEKEDEPVSAKVYLVRYSVEMTEDNISVFMDKESTAQASTDEAGYYCFEDVLPGNYSLVVEAEGCPLSTQLIYVDTNYDGNRDFVVDDIYIVDLQGETGSVQGSVIDAATGEAPEAGLKVILRKGMNNITSQEVETLVLGEDGTFQFADLEPGQYTIQVRDMREESEYVSAYENVAVLSGATAGKTIYVSKRLDSGEIRFVLTWGDEESGASKDLDLHVYGPNPFTGGEYLVNRSNRTYGAYQLADGAYHTLAQLDVDDKEYEGPETVTVQTPAAGRYKVFVRDYTNGNKSTQLGSSSAVIRIYSGSALKDTVKLSKEGQTGGIWYAGDYDTRTGKFSLADELGSRQPNETVKAKIGTVLNQLEQFEVTDVEAFGQYQDVIDAVKGSYLSMTDSDALNEVLKNIQGVYEALCEALRVSSVECDGSAGYQDAFISNHSINMYRQGDSIDGFRVTMAQEGAEASKLEEVNASAGRYLLVLSNPSAGVAARYYVSLYQYGSYSDNWISNIEDLEDESFCKDLNTYSASVGGSSSEISRKLVITPYDGVEIVSKEYRSDYEEEEEWRRKYEGYQEYYNEDGDLYDVYEGSRVDLVLHLKRTLTGETKDYTIKYIPVGAYLLRLEDAGNDYTEQYDGSSWYQQENGRGTYSVTGRNAELGKDWIPVVSEGAEYTVKYPDDEDWDGGSYAALVSVTHENGASCRYYIRYAQDTSDAELLGLYDPENVFTYYDQYDNNYGNGTTSIYLKGVNSELGNTLAARVRPGAEAEIEYKTASESWDSSSDAKITVTAKSGVKRIYYVGYSKTNIVVNLKSIQSETNELKKVYISGSTLYITGGNRQHGELLLTTREGYSAEQQGSAVVVTDDDTGESSTYYIYYKRDISGIELRSLKSASDQNLKCSVESYYGESLYEETEEYYYNINLVGDAADCPEDLSAYVPTGAESEITYASKTEDWSYTGYAAKVVVTSGDVSQIYLVSYRQDDSGAVIRSIKDADNPYAYIGVNSYKDTIYYYNSLGEETYENVYYVSVIGANMELGDTYSVVLPKGTEVLNQVSSGDKNWPYQSRTKGLWCYLGSNEYYITTYHSARIEVQAANGARRVYVVSYGQDPRQLQPTNITDSNNSYTYTKIDSERTAISYKNAQGEESSEEVYLIRVVGKNADFGDSYELHLPEETKTETITPADPDWIYGNIPGQLSQIKWEKDVDGSFYRTRHYKADAHYAARVEVEAPSGARRVFMILYAPDEEEAAVQKVTDKEGKEFIYSSIAEETSNVYFDKSINGQNREEVDIIKIVGDASELASDFDLVLTEGSTYTCITPESEEWNYTRTSSPYVWVFDQDGRFSYSVPGAYAARIEVTAHNGAKRVYVIEYAQDDRGAVAKGILLGENNQCQCVINDDTSSVRFYDPQEGIVWKGVYQINVVGINAQLGNSAKLDLPDGCSQSKITPKDESWNCKESECSFYWNYEDGQSEYVTGKYAALFEVTAENGVKREYLVAYAQDPRGLEVNGIQDEANPYTEKKIDTKATAIPCAEGQEETSEEVYLIRVVGKDAELGKDFVLELSDESSKTEKIFPDEEGWIYGEISEELSSFAGNDDNGSYSYSGGKFAASVKVTAESGAERTYVIIYYPDEAEAAVKAVTFNGNKDCVCRISPEATYLYYREPQDGSWGERVYLIEAVGNEPELGADFDLTLTENSAWENTTPESGNWKYCSTSHTIRWTDEEGGETDQFNGNISARIEVTAHNGAKRVYVIVYAQDQRSVTASGITDSNNVYAYTSIRQNPESMYYTGSDGKKYSEEVYRVYVLGNNEELGNTFSLQLPEGCEEERIYAGEDGWNYTSSEAEFTMYTAENEYYRFFGTYAARVEVTNNKVKRIYVIMYFQDDREARILNITDGDDNAFTYTRIENNSRNNWYNYNTGRYENGYEILAVGSEKEMGTYKLQLSEGAEVESTVLVDEEWPYAKDDTFGIYFDEESSHTNVYGKYYAKVVIKAKNGAKRTYRIAYGQDPRGLRITKMEDSNNEYIYTDIQEEPTAITYTDKDGEEQTEDVYLIRAVGKNDTLGDTFTLTPEEGCEIFKVTPADDPEWEYGDIPDSLRRIYWSIWNGEENRTDSFDKRWALYAAKVEVKAANSERTRTYIIIYAAEELKKDTSDVAALQKIIDAQKELGVELPDISSQECYDWNGRGHVTDIYWSNRGLKGEVSFSGLPKLKYLNCYSGQITALDVSKNTALQTLDCSNNQLTVLDVSQNKKLQNLECHSNGLTNLDVSNNTELKELECGYNQLSSLDVTQNTKLTDLNCNRNQLTELDVSHNTALKILYCENSLTNLDLTSNLKLAELGCSNNQLQALDVSKNSELKVLTCTNNQLTDLDVSHNTKMYFLSCYQNQLTALNLKQNTALIRLECSDNKLEELDISNNTALYYLSCNINNLANLDVSNNTELTSIYCEGNQLTELDLKNNTELRNLYCYSNQLKNLDLQRNMELRNLDCHENQLTKLDLTYNPKLGELYCSENQLAELKLESNAELQKLSCFSNQLTKLDLKYNANLISLHCYDNKLEDLDLTCNPELQDLYCYKNQLKSLDIKNNGKLKTLYCYENQLDNLDLSSNTELTWLNCSSNQLTKLDVSNNVELWQLYCADNQIASLDITNNPNLYDLKTDETVTVTRSE